MNRKEFNQMSGTTQGTDYKDLPSWSPNILSDVYKPQCHQNKVGNRNIRTSTTWTPHTSPHLSLGVVEVSWHGDDGILDRSVEVSFTCLLHLGKNKGSNLRWGVHLPIICLYPGISITGLHYLEWHRLPERWTTALITSGLKNIREAT